MNEALSTTAIARPDVTLERPFDHERPPTKFREELGAKAMIAPEVLDLITSASAEHVAETAEGGNVVTSVPMSPEAAKNRELYKRAYDAAVEAIARASTADESELANELANAVDSIQALREVPYIASAPEFVDLVESAREIVERLHSAIESGNTTTSTGNLASASEKIAGTMVAYRP